MSKRDLSFFIIDIFVAIDKIRRYTDSFSDVQALLHSEINWDATIRKLEIIGEATNKILQITNDSSREKRRIIDFRNQISHGYFGIDENIVWDVIKHKLPLLYTGMIDLSRTIDLTQALKSVYEEHQHHPDALQALEKIKAVTVS